MKDVGKDKRLKVILLCGFSNKSVQKNIKPLKQEKEHALWISNLIDLFEYKDDVELHVIAPHRYIPWTKSFFRNGIHYYFIHRGMPIIGRNWPGFFPLDVWVDYYGIKRTVKKLVKRIKPDLIHLHGAENTYHTPAIIQFHNKYPILVTLQGFISKSAEAHSRRVRKRQQREQYLLLNFKYFTFGRKIIRDEVESINPSAKFYQHNVLRPKISEIPVTQKEYDLVFFARINKSKGIEDLLKTLSILKSRKRDISLLIIGQINSNYQKYLNNISESLRIKNNIYFAGFLPTLKEVHSLAIKAKVSVLPTYNDMFSGTIAESMFLKIPVVSYATGGIPEANEKEEVISLVDPGNIEMLSDKIYELLEDKNLREERAYKAQKRIREMFDNTKTYSNLINIYYKVINDYYST